MSPELGLYAALGVFLLLVVVGMPVPFAILLPGMLYLFLLGDWQSFNALGLISWANLNSFTLTAIPMFLLVAEILEASGLTVRIYRGLAKLLSWLPGGLLQTNIGGCALFAAVSGSSVATAATIGSAALPELLKRRYHRRLAAGSLAAGGTLGILIPPSLPMIIYSTFTDTSIAKLFMAGVVPGLLLTAMFMVYLGIRAKISPEIAPHEPGPDSFGEAMRALWDVIPVTMLIVIVMGSLYTGIATPTEAAAVACVAALAIAVTLGNLTLPAFLLALKRTALSCANIVFLVFAAYVFSHAIAYGGVGEEFTQWVIGLNLSRVEFLLVLFVMYTILGCLIEGVGMIVMTVPILFPIMAQYHIDPIWFGIILVVFIEMGMISPPIGINLFVIQSQWDGTLKDVALGTIPFHILMLVLLVMLVFWPEIALWLPDNMSGP